MNEVVVVKLSSGEIVMGELHHDDERHLSVTHPIKIIQTPTPTNNPGEYITVNVPVLFNPFSASSITTLSKNHIVYYDLADDYYILFYETCYAALIEAEMRKQEMITKLYAGEDEQRELQWDDEDPIVPKESQSKTVAELFEEYQSELDDTANTDYNSVDGNKTLH